MLFFSFLDINGHLQITKVKMLEAFRVSKVTDILNRQSISQLTSSLFNIRGMKSNKALVSDLFKKICPDSSNAPTEETEELIKEFKKVITCYFS